MTRNSRSIQQLLIKARCDPNSRNGSGQCVDPSWFRDAPALPATSPAVPSAASGASPLDVSGLAIHGNGSVAVVQQMAEEGSKVTESYHLIESPGGRGSELENSFLDYTLSMLKVPVRDAVAFSRNERAKTLARLTKLEGETGVWSEWVVNYTHAGLRDALDMARPAASPLLQDRNRQAIVLTCDRLLLFNASSWSLSTALALIEITEVCTFAQSSTVLLIRSSRRPDVLLDLEARGRFLDELQVASQRLSGQRLERGESGDHSIPIRSSSESVSFLQDERQNIIGTVAYVEANAFLFLPHEPSSLLLSGAAPAFFGFLDLQRSARSGVGSGVHWRWEHCFFILKHGVRSQRRLVWCRHPNDSHESGQLLAETVRHVKSIDSLQGEPCIVVEWSDSRSTAEQSITLRAKSAKIREHWTSSLRGLCGHADHQAAF